MIPTDAPPQGETVADVLRTVLKSLRGFSRARERYRCNRGGRGGPFDSGHRGAAGIELQASERALDGRYRGEQTEAPGVRDKTRYFAP